MPERTESQKGEVRPSSLGIALLRYAGIEPHGDNGTGKCVCGLPWDEYHRSRIVKVGFVRDDR